MATLMKTLVKTLVKTLILLSELCLLTYSLKLTTSGLTVGGVTGGAQPPCCAGDPRLGQDEQSSLSGAGAAGAADTTAGGETGCPGPTAAAARPQSQRRHTHGKLPNVKAYLNACNALLECLLKIASVSHLVNREQAIA